MWKQKADEDLNKIITSQCMNSYLNTNRKKDGTFYKKHRPYSVPAKAMQALGLLNRLRIKEDSITAEEWRLLEEEVKAFLLPFRTFRANELI